MTNMQNLMDISVRIYDETAGVDFTFSTFKQAEASVGNDKTILVSLNNLTYNKQVNSPCSARAELHIENAYSAELRAFTKFFIGKKVDFVRTQTGQTMGVNYFIYKVTPNINSSGATTVVLDIYSLDKLLDIVKYSRSYVSRKLRAEILPDAVGRCKHGNLSVPVADDDKLQLLTDGTKEFMQPYVVQYNETPYSMLSRTANRCGEFLFFEGGKLHLGLTKAGTDVENCLQVKNADGCIRFLSISCSDSVGTDFTSQQFHINNYLVRSATGYDAALHTLEADMPNVLIAIQSLIEQLEKINSVSANNYVKILQTALDLFQENKDYYDCYYKEKMARAAYLHYFDEIKKKNNELATYKYQGGVFAEDRIQAEFVPYMNDAIDKQRADLKAAQAEKNHNNYEGEKLVLDNLAAKRDAAKKEWEEAAPEKQSEKRRAYLDACAMYDNENNKYQNPDIDTRINEENAKIKQLQDKLTELECDLRDWQSEAISADTKAKILNKYRVDICKRLQSQYDALYNEMKELIDAVDELLKNPPAVYTKYQDSTSDVWKKLRSWKGNIEDEKKEKNLENVWDNTLKKGKERFPIDKTACITDLKKCAENISSDIDSNKLLSGMDDEKKKAQVNCKAIIDYCNAYLEVKCGMPNPAALTSRIYDFEYGNAEYLQTVSKNAQNVKNPNDTKCGYNDFYFSGLTRGQTTASYGWAGFLSIAARFLTDRKTKLQFLAAEAMKQVVINATAGTNYELFKKKYNKDFITGYQINGDNKPELLASTSSENNSETSLFTDYTHKTTNKGLNADAQELFSGMFYKSVHALERLLDQRKIEIKVDCSVNDKEPQLGSLIKYGDKVYIIVGIRGALMTDAQMTGVPPRLEQIIEAVPKANNDLILPPMGDVEHYHKSEPQIATVADDNDPCFQGRVRVRFHWQNDEKDEPSPWIRVGSPYATKGGGMLFIPQKGDQVMLDFEHGNVERPFVTTSLYCEGDKILPPTTISNAPRRQTISSANGHGITFTDKKNATFLTQAFSSFPLMTNLGGTGEGAKFGTDTQIGGGVEISDSFGFYKIACSADKRNITVESPFGDVKLNAFTGITISAPNGDVKIEAKNIELNAGNEIKITSGTYLKDELDLRKDGTWNALGSAFASELAGLITNSIDFSLIRHILERFVRPVSASLSIKAYRFILIDSGAKSFDFENTILDENSWNNKARNKRSTDSLKSKIANQFKNMALSGWPETNLWKVQSNKDAIIIAGQMYGTNSKKNLFKKNDGQRFELGRNLVEGDDRNPLFDQNLAKSYDKVGFDNVKGRVKFNAKPLYNDQNTNEQLDLHDQLAANIRDFGSSIEQIKESVKEANKKIDDKETELKKSIAEGKVSNLFTEWKMNKELKQVKKQLGFVEEGQKKKKSLDDFWVKYISNDNKNT